MRIRALALFLVLAAGLVAGARQPKGKPKVYKTPQEVFKAFIAAINKDDGRGVIECYPPAAQKTMARNSAIHGVHLRSIAKEKGGKVDGKDLKKVLDVMDKHGLTAKATKGITGSERGKARQKAKTTLLGLIEDPAAFVADFRKALDDVFRKPDDKEPPKIKARLTGVKITGNKARGTAIVTVGGKEEKHRHDFVKVGKGWKMVPPPDELEDLGDPDLRKGKKPPPDKGAPR
jgi:hypothetical protein